jgi:hypothetical protein
MHVKTPSQIISPEKADLAQQQQEEGLVRALVHPDLGLVKVMVRVMVVPGRAKEQVRVMMALDWVRVVL